MFTCNLTKLTSVPIIAHNSNIHFARNVPFSQTRSHILSWFSQLCIVQCTSFLDGEWDWDNYSIVVLSQRKDLPCSAIAAVKFNVWCSIGNVIHVVHSHLLKMEVRLHTVLAS